MNIQPDGNVYNHDMEKEKRDKTGTECNENSEYTDRNMERNRLEDEDPYCRGKKAGFVVCGTLGCISDMMGNCWLHI